MPRAIMSILADLHRKESSSLFRYLAESPSYFSPAAAQWLPILRAMGDASYDRMARLEAFLDEANEAYGSAGFPSNFASLHYLSINYLLGRLVADKRVLATAYADAEAMVRHGDAESVEPSIAEFIQSAAAAHAGDLLKLQSFAKK